MPACFLRRDRKRGDEEELGGVGGIVIRIYCVNKNIFNKRNKNKQAKTKQWCLHTKVWTDRTHLT